MMERAIGASSAVPKLHLEPCQILGIALDAPIAHSIMNWRYFDEFGENEFSSFLFEMKWIAHMFFP